MLAFFTLHLFHFWKVELFSLSVYFYPDGEGRALLGGKESTLPHAENSVKSDLVLEERDIHVCWQFLVYLLKIQHHLLLSLSQRSQRDLHAHLDHVFPKLGSLHETMVWISLAGNLNDHWWIFRTRVSFGAIISDSLRLGQFSAVHLRLLILF